MCNYAPTLFLDFDPAFGYCAQ